MYPMSCYIRADDAYRCPAGERLRRRQTTLEKDINVHAYWTNTCSGCRLRAQYTTGKERRGAALGTRRGA